MQEYNRPLYKLESKKALVRILHIPNNAYLKQSFISQRIHPYIENNNSSKRLIEPPEKEIKIIQSRIKNLLAQNEYPEYIFSGIKGRSYVENARMHEGNMYNFKIDLTAFFPSVSREAVFHFFYNDMRMSKDVAEIVTNFTTVDIDKADATNMEDINNFFKFKRIKVRNHLISGSPSSPILSYLVNRNMFNELKKLANNNGMVMTVYVDDIMFSSKNNISNKFKYKIFRIISKHGYYISRKKVKMCSPNYPIQITGVVVNSQGLLVIPNKLRINIIQEFKKLKKDKANERAFKRLSGLLVAAQLIDPSAYPQISRFVKDIRIRKIPKN